MLRSPLTSKSRVIDIIMEIFSCWSQLRNVELCEVLEEIGKFALYFVISMQGIVIPPLAG